MNTKSTNAKARSAATPPDLSPEERVFHRDQLREARYAALADAEGFQQMCFAIEALGKRLKPEGNGLGALRNVLQRLSRQSSLLPKVGESRRPIKTFDALFVSLKDARNDAMHTGAYARHVAADAVNLCLVLEDALMVDKKSAEEIKRLTVGDFMVASPVVVQPWQTVEHARQLMLMNSFSHLPIWHDGKWWLISDTSVAQYLRPHWPAHGRLRETLTQAKKNGLTFECASPVQRSDSVNDLLNRPGRPGLWLVNEEGYPIDHLVGVLSPFELM